MMSGGIEFEALIKWGNICIMSCHHCASFASFFISKLRMSGCVLLTCVIFNSLQGIKGNMTGSRKLGTYHMFMYNWSFPVMREVWPVYGWRRGDGYTQDRMVVVVLLDGRNGIGYLFLTLMIWKCNFLQYYACGICIRCLFPLWWFSVCFSYDDSQPCLYSTYY